MQCLLCVLSWLRIIEVVLQIFPVKRRSLDSPRILCALCLVSLGVSNVRIWLKFFFLRILLWQLSSDWVLRWLACTFVVVSRALVPYSQTRSLISEWFACVLCASRLRHPVLSMSLTMPLMSLLNCWRVDIQYCCWANPRTASCSATHEYSCHQWRDYLECALECAVQCTQYCLQYSRDRAARVEGQCRGYMYKVEVAAAAMAISVRKRDELYGFREWPRDSWMQWECDDWWNAPHTQRTRGGVYRPLFVSMYDVGGYRASRSLAACAPLFIT